MLDSIYFKNKEEALSMIYDISRDNKCLLVCSKSLVAKLEIGTILDSDNIFHIDNVPPNPRVEDLYNNITKLKDLTFSKIIAIGGGSSIDMAKGISAFYEYRKRSCLTLSDLIEAITKSTYNQNKEFIDIIALPTTSGTGSEVTRWATIWDIENSKKYSIDNKALCPKEVIVVSEFTLNLPDKITLSTGLDALSHAAEAFWSKSRNPLSQELALLAIKLIQENLAKVLENGKNIKLREEMSKASIFAGLSFSSTKTTACHSISYPLTMRYNIEHGFAVATSLVSVAKRNATRVPEVKKIFDIFGGEEAFAYWVQNLTEPTYSLKLSNLGVKEKEIKQIAKQTFTQGRMDNNPILFTEAEVEEILREIFY